MPALAPAIQIRPRRALFHAEGGWFSANWHFSFDRYRLVETAVSA